MSYKHKEPFKQKALNLHSLLYIYFQSLSLKYHSFFSKNDTYLNTRESLNSSKKHFTGTSHIDYEERIKL